MSDIQTRPFSKNYSGLINQSVIAICITVLCVSGHEFMKRRRRGKYNLRNELGSRESWEFGYLYQGRSWARIPSPPTPRGWILSWVGQAFSFSEAKIHELRGTDATLYIRFLRGSLWFALLQALTTFPILFPIHVRFSDDTISPKSMTRASISSLVGNSTGRSLLWIHICLLFWITLTWIATLLWICIGAFKFRAADIDAVAKHISSDTERNSNYYPHPHPQFGFTEIPLAHRNHPNKGLRCRTIMVSNVPHLLRKEKDLKEYFEYYMSRKLEKPSMGLTSSIQPGFFNKYLAFLFNRAKRLPTRINPLLPGSAGNRTQSIESTQENSGDPKEDASKPIIETVVIARKMTELASLMERREDILRLLETAHIKLANKALLAVKAAMERQSAKKPLAHSASRAMEVARQRRSVAVDLENGISDEVLDEETRMEQLIKVLGPFVEEFSLQNPLVMRSKKAISRTSQHALQKLRNRSSRVQVPDEVTAGSDHPPTRQRTRTSSTVWDALLSLPRSSLDAYQPLINLEHLFRGQIVPSIDYYTTKLNLLTTLITEQRAKLPTDFEPVSTAFVTFADPADARRACKYLAVHPNDPLTCLVTLAPMYNDLDWIRVMKSSFRAELIKDWVVNLWVWGFTLFWLFPVSLLVGLVSIQNISLFWPSLKRYLEHHPWESEVIQSFLPTLLVALLALLIPLVLLLIAKKAHTITTLSALHDRIMTRYYKFLIVNVLVFFCVGTAALQSVLQSFRSPGNVDVVQIVADSFPTAGPFYVGWLIFTTAMHGGFELALFGLPLIMYPTTRRQITPRKRAIGIRPRTFNYYYWLPNHLLVIHVLLLFSVLNPFVLPFGVIYFSIQCGVVKNQLLHVYAKHYEANGQILLIRIVRYSLDGLVLSQSVFLAYMVVLKKSVNVGLSAFLIAFTIITKVILTRICRTQFETQDILEANLLCNKQQPAREGDVDQNSLDEEVRGAGSDQESNGLLKRAHRQSRLASPFKTWKLPHWVDFTYSSAQHHALPQRRPPIPFARHEAPFSRLHSQSMDQQTISQEIRAAPPPRSTHSEIQQTDYFRSSPKLRSQTAQSPGNKPVVPHLPPTPWDDQRVPDLPYDNPFYTRRIDNVLWLPRNPCGLLDLDDTIDLKVSLTVEPAAGELGAYPFGLLEGISSGELTQISSRPLTASPVPFVSELPEVDGTEEIELPAAIAKRVKEGEGDVERPPRPRTSSGYRGKLNGAAKSTLSLGTLGAVPSAPHRHSSFLEVPGAASLSSSHDGTGREHGGRRRSHSIMSALQLPPPTEGAKPSNHELGIRHEGRLQADALSENASTSRMSLIPPTIRPSRSQNLSPSNAILREVYAEEQDAKEQHIREEQNEATRSQNNKSWWTSWMFKKLD